mmetsp:Transcript_73910/g.123444  ORF Transcript_73910/g.123444 Transcript_73910/m.123444 type:complete len:269 (-) Transcript_73910:474-1280(-)
MKSDKRAAVTKEALHAAVTKATIQLEAELREMEASYMLHRERRESKRTVCGPQHAEINELQKRLQNMRPQDLVVLQNHVKEMARAQDTAPPKASSNVRTAAAEAPPDAISASTAFAPTTNGAERDREPPLLTRRFSARSEQVVRELEVVASQLSKLELLADEAGRLLDRMEAGAMPLQPSLRNTLAQLHGDCARLLSIGGRLLSAADESGAAPNVRALDAFTTGDIASAREAVRSNRKVLVQAAETLSSRLASQVKRYDTLKMRTLQK